MLYSERGEEFIVSSEQRQFSFNRVTQKSPFAIKNEWYFVDNDDDRTRRENEFVLS